MLKRSSVIICVFIAMAFSSLLKANSPCAQASPLLDLTFEKAGSAALFTATNGSVSQNNGSLVYAFQKASSLSSPSFENSRNGIYNPTLEVRNTMFFIMENRSSATRLKLSFITDEDRTYDNSKSKVFDIQPNTPKSAFYFNISDNPKAKGRLMGLRIEPLDGSGKLIIDRITFEQENRLEPFAGEIISCQASKKYITVKGHIAPEYLDKYSKIVIYETSMLLKTDDILKMTRLCETQLTKEFCIAKIPMQNENTTRLSSQFLAVAEDSNGNFLKIGPRFYVENWSDFENNPYAFKLPGLTVNVLDYGAKGDGFTDDTDAIQAAIDDVTAKGGGQVVLSGDNSFYGKRYVATNILMKSNVDLHIEKGAILWQSQNESDYKYKTAYGHEGSIPGINWTHNMHVSNLPLIQGKEIENIKITGQGRIRSMDVESTDNQFPDYRRFCNDRIHVIPIGMWKVKNMEVSNVEIVRTNNYHTAFYGCENIFIGNVKMHEVKCVSGDGMGLGMGTHNVKIVRVFDESNDDGVVLWTAYNDPRGILWWWAQPGKNNSVYNVTVCHSYINSGAVTGGKAIAFIPWGTDDPNWENQEIYNITVYDNVLNGGYSVGTWPDNPYGGKQPFNNTETNDYSPVKNVRIYNNKYLSKCDLLCIQPTNTITDCGIHSSETFRNANFEHGHTNWTTEGQAGAESGYGFVKEGRLYEGLWLKKGTYTFSGNTKGCGELFVQDAAADKMIKKSKIRSNDWNSQSLTIKVEADGTFYLGIKGKDARIKEVQLKNETAQKK